LLLSVGILTPFLGTVLGSATVFFLKKELDPRWHKALLGFASGVMLAASVWSLLIPAITMSEAAGGLSWLPAVLGFLLGNLLLLLSDRLSLAERLPVGRRSGVGRSISLIFAVTLHNLPEGMAVGVVLAGARSGGDAVSAAGALALSFGIALQNLPEGAIISMPLASGGASKTRAFAVGALSGIVEPIGAILTLLLTSLLAPILPYLLSFAAGAMIYVVLWELTPETLHDGASTEGILGAAIGFALMMLLDIALG
jgi:ZIP family zinc transporter